MIKLSPPSFWYEQKNKKDRVLAKVLSPLGRLYAFFVRQRFDMHYPAPLSRPVVCVGNLVMGGAGKTPTVMALVSVLQDLGFNPHLLTRGYGGQEEGPLQVAATRDTAADVGDEALILTQSAPTWVSRHRALGAQSAIDSGADIIIMDDGFQNPAIYKDFSLLVIDGKTGFGNGQVFPAGPLREDIALGLARADAVLIIGDDLQGIAEKIKRYRDLPVLTARLVPAAGNPDIFGKQVFAFAGIGRPEKFRETLTVAGAIVAGWSAFPDHYTYVQEDLEEMLRVAAAQDAMILTTTKDYVRLPRALAEKIQPFAVALEWQDLASMQDLLARKVGRK